MKKFDGILLASDWDGTLYYNGDVSDENARAIKYFQENGGNFTVCSGRALSFIDEHSTKVRPNTYAIALNGAYIANLDTGEVLYQNTCDRRLPDIVDLLYGNEEFDRLYLHPENAPSRFYSKEDYFADAEQIRKNRYYKAVLCAKSDEDGDVGIKKAKSHSFDGYTIVRSFRTGIEILKSENTKGAAIQRLAGELGSRLTVAVGDYENDISMLRAADIGFAVENATEAVKRAADRITVSCADSALSKVINEIEIDILPKIK